MGGGKAEPRKKSMALMDFADKFFSENEYKKQRELEKDYWYLADWGNSTFADPDTFGLTYDQIKKKIRELKNSMDRGECGGVMSPIAKTLLDADTQALVSAGLLDSNLDLSSRGWHMLKAILFTANKEALVKAAKEILDAAKA